VVVAISGDATRFRARFAFDPAKLNVAKSAPVKQKVSATSERVPKIPDWKNVFFFITKTDEPERLVIANSERSVLLAALPRPIFAFSG
jgi:hypothetical protein